MTHICVSNLTIIGSDNILLRVRRQAIIWSDADLLSIGPYKHICERAINLAWDLCSQYKAHVRHIHNYCLIAAEEEYVPEAENSE